MLRMPLTYAQEYYTVLEDTLTDNLTSLDDIKWYSFEMNEPGDAELIINGLQIQWDGYTSHWSATIYAPDMQTVLAEDTARGYNDEYNLPTQFSLLDLEIGTYYIRVSSASRSHFTTDFYRLELNRIYSSTQPFVNSSDDNMYVIGTEPFMDRLVSKDQVRWYAFEMTEPGDVTLTVTGLQDHSDGYSYHWNCAIYDENRTSIITSADVSGYSEYSGPSILSVPELETGIYYVRIKSASSSNPFMTTFTTAPYRIQLIRSKTDGSQSEDADDDGAEDWLEENMGNIVLFVVAIVLTFIIIRLIVMRFIVVSRLRKPSNSNNFYHSRRNYSSGGSSRDWEPISDNDFQEIIAKETHEIAEEIHEMEVMNDIIKALNDGPDFVPDSETYPPDPETYPSDPEAYNTSWAHDI